MKQPTSINSQLDCKATASLSLEVLNDLEQKDRPLASLINDEQSEDDREAQDIKNPST
jgi:hypothetical protein